MATFPNNPTPHVGSKEKTYVPLIKTESDGNYTKTRRRATKARKKFDLEYRALTMSEFDILENFFLANNGTSFTFTHPVTEIEYDCIFVTEELEKNWQDSQFISTTISLEEV